MKKKILSGLIISICLLLSSYALMASERTPAVGEAFIDISLDVPDKECDRNYLGLEGKGSFQIPQIKADVLIIEIFSMYCPYCQKEAPLINDLYDIINNKPELKDRIKIIGIGAGNTPFEVNVFKNQYNIRFPLLSDESFAVHKAVGEVRTPYFFVIKKNADGTNTIVYSKVGSIEDPNKFLDIIIKESGLTYEA